MASILDAIDPTIFDTVAPPAGGNLFEKIAGGAVTYYDTLNQINAAKYGAKLTKAQAQAAVAQAKAAGAANAEFARAGMPSQSLLLMGGLALAALLVLKK